MTPRTRRLLTTLATVVALLFVGRWGAGFLAERWWAAAIAPGAADLLSRWQVLGLLLAVAAVVVASLWFTAQALLVTRTVVSVQVTHRVGDLQLREAISARVLVLVAVGAGVVLGVLTGAAAPDWRGPIVLAWQGVHYGVTDPLLKLDLGVYVAQLPAWDLALHFAALLSVLGLAFCVALYSVIGGIRRDGRRLAVHADTRRHLGALLATVAAVIVVAYLMVPLHIAAAQSGALTASANDRVHAAQLMAGLAAATVVLTCWWALRGRGTLLVSTWLLLGAGALTVHYVVPAMADDAPLVASQLATIRRFDAMAWGIRQPHPTVSADSIPPITALWDAPMLARLVASSGGALDAATPTVVTGDSGDRPVWLVATTPGDDSDRIDLLAIAAGAIRPDGQALSLPGPDAGRRPHPVWQTLAHPRTSPDAPPWSYVDTGVPIAGPLRHVLLAWARQAPGMLRSTTQSFVDWHLDPVERATALLPMFTWLAADVVWTGGHLLWLVQGMATVPEFPLATRVNWNERAVAGAVPAVDCTVDASSGATRCYVDPAADALGLAWARITGELVMPTAAMPAAVRTALTYPADWFDAQADVLAGPAWRMGQRPATTASMPTTMPIWTAARVPARQAEFDDPSRESVSAVATAYRLDGIPQLQLRQWGEVPTATGNRAEMREEWSRNPMMSHLRDSIAATGDSLFVRPLRWFDGRLGDAGWQTRFAARPHGPPVVVWIATALADHLAGGRRPDDAWRAALQPVAAPQVDHPDLAATLQNARQWVERADSAFRRGDLTAFGRDFEELRKVLEPRP